MKVKQKQNAAFRFIIHLFTDDIFGRAAQMAFYMLLAFCPLCMFATGTLARFDINFSSNDFLPKEIEGLLKEAAMPDLNSPLLFITSAWAASSAVMAMIRAVARAYKTGSEKNDTGISVTRFAKSWLSVRLIALGFTVGFVAVLALTLGSMLYDNSLGRIASYVAIFTLLFSLYLFTPGTTAKPKRVAWTALAATFGWYLVSKAFELYISHFSKYTILYGSVGTFLGLALWLWLISLVIIIGAELGGEI